MPSLRITVCSYALRSYLNIVLFAALSVGAVMFRFLSIQHFLESTVVVQLDTVQQHTVGGSGSV